MTQPRIIAVEGPCCAGKTTLSTSLVAAFADAVHVPCYADHVGGGRHLPRPEPMSTDEDAAGLRRLMSIEQERFATAGSSRVVFADRSWRTFLAHRRGVGPRVGIDLESPAKDLIVASTQRVDADLIVYLDTPIDTMRSRNHDKFPPDSLFIDSAYNQNFRDYFVDFRRAYPDELLWLDGRRPASEVLEAAQQWIERR